MDYTGLRESLAELQRRSDQLKVSLPNLRCTQVFPTVGTNMVISAEVENNGTEPTTHGCWAQLVLTATSRGHAHFNPPPVHQTIGPLGAGQRAIITFPVIAGVPEDSVVFVCVTVDVPTAANWAGLIRESNELDNTTCTWWATKITDLDPPKEHKGYNIDRIPPEDPDWGKHLL